MPEGLKLVVSADVQQAERDIKSFVDNSTKAISSLGNAGDLDKLESAFKDLQKQGLVSLGSIQSALLELKSILKQTSDPGDISKLNQAIKFLGDQEKNLLGYGIDKHLEKVGVSSLRANSAALSLTHTFGLIPSESSHVAHSLESIISAFEQMENQTGSVSGGLISLGKTLAGGLGIGLAITGIQLLIAEFFSAEKGVDQAALSLERFKDHLDLVSEGLKNFKADKDFLDKIAHLRDEIAGISGANLQIRDLKRDQQTNSQTLDVLREDLAKVNSEIEKSVKLAALGGIHLSTVEPIPKTVIASLNDTNKALAEGFNDLIKKKKEFESEITKGEQDNILLPLQISAEKTKQALKDITFDPILKVKLRGITIAEQLGNEIRKQFDTERSPIKIPKIFISPSEIKLFNINLDTLGTDFSSDTGDKISNDLKKHISSKPLIVEIPIKPSIVLKAKQLQSALDDINKIISSTLTEGLVSIGEGIGNILAGGSVADAFKSFLNIVGSGVEAIGKRMIELGTVALLADKAVSQLFKNPALSIAAGIALVAIGAAMKKTLSGGVHGFADGGLVFGPTIGLVGEGPGTSRTNPEVIAPLDKLVGLLGTNRHPEILIQRVRGNNLELIRQRTLKQNKRW